MFTAALGWEYARPSASEFTEYPGNVRQRSYSAPVPPIWPQRGPGYAVPDTCGPDNR